MTSTILLVRHAAHDGVGDRLTGRLPGVRLGLFGQEQARRLAERLQLQAPSAIIASPQPRTQETAAAIASACGMTAFDTEPGLDEIDFGDAWTNKTWLELDEDPRWHRWNGERAVAATQGGETMAIVQARMVAALQRAVETPDDGRPIIVVTHADLIKAAVCHVLQLPLDAVHRFDVDPASTTGLLWGDWGAKLLWLNERTG